MTNFLLQIHICTSYRTVSNAIWKIFYEFLVFYKLEASEITVKYEKRVNYISISHEVNVR